MKINTIEFKLTAGVFLLIVVLTVLLSTVGYLKEKKIVEERVYAQLNGTADLKKGIVIGYINERINDLKVLASAQTLRKRILAAAGEGGARERREGGDNRQYVYNRLKSLKEVHAEYLSLEINDPRGSLIVSTEDVAGGGHGRRHEHSAEFDKFIDIIKASDVVVMQKDLQGEEGHFDVALGVTDREGDVGAIIIGSVLLESTLAPLFRDYSGLSTTGEALLVKKSGGGIVHITPTRFQPARAEKGSGNKEHIMLGLRAASGNEGIDEGGDYRNKKVIAAYRYIPLLKWGIVVKMDYDEAFGEIIALRRKLLIFGTVVLCIMLTATYIVVKRFSEPIVMLAGKTKDVAAGDYSIRIESGRGDEIGTLEKNFNEMVGELDRSSREIRSKQEELETVNAGLERKVLERTEKLSEANAALVEALDNLKKEAEEKRALEGQLQQSQKMEAIGQLAGGVAHDFNNILTAIMGYSHILHMKMKADDPRRTFAEQIQSSSERAAELVQGLLAFSRKQIINPKPVDVNEIVKRVQTLLFRLIGEDIEIKTSVSDEALTVMADSGQIEQVLMNLATNARDAMPEGGVLSIETKVAELGKDFFKTHGYGKSGSYALISVTDTGAGMDEDTRLRIFDPFFTTKEVGKGTGLGLSIVYGIIKQHEGTIDVYSEQGEGTTFKIYLPLSRGGLERADQKSLLPVEGGAETILMAEDEPAVRELLMTVLKDFGYKVIAAVDGEDAVNKFIENQDDIQLVILDVIMPKKNGKMTYEEMSRIRPGLRALFTSGYTADVIDRKGIVEGEFHFISKPVSPDELLRKVRSMLDQGRVG